MQKLYFKKEIDLEGKLKEIISISVNESIDYRVEKNGMRAIGNIIITGDIVMIMKIKILLILLS